MARTKAAGAHKAAAAIYEQRLHVALKVGHRTQTTATLELGTDPEAAAQAVIESIQAALRDWRVRQTWITPAAPDPVDEARWAQATPARIDERAHYLSEA